VKVGLSSRCRFYPTLVRTHTRLLVGSKDYDFVQVIKEEEKTAIYSSIRDAAAEFLPAATGMDKIQKHPRRSDNTLEMSLLVRLMLSTEATDENTGGATRTNHKRYTVAIGCSKGAAKCKILSTLYGGANAPQWHTRSRCCQVADKAADAEAADTRGGPSASNITAMYLW
jgi:hypothetical protein